MTEADPASARADDEPVSPELALVDPELARRQRERLPDPPSFSVTRERSAPRAPVVERSWIDEVRRGLPPEPEAAPAQARKKRRTLRRAALLMFAAVLAAAIGVAVAVIRADGETPRLLPATPASPATATPPAAPTPSRTTPATRTRPPASSRPKQSQQPSPAPARTQTAEAPPAPPPPPAAPPPPAPAPPPPAAPAPEVAEPRTFAWVAVPGASHYRVEFYRGRTRIFRAHPVRARIVVPGRWTYRGATFSFAPGRYRWVVRAGFGSRARARYGPPLVSSAWVVPRST